MLAALTHAEGFLQGMRFEALEADLRTQYALERAFTIIGEAAKKIEEPLRGQHPDVPWKAIAGMRDVLVHGYWAVNLEVVWKTVHEDFPGLRSQIQRVLAALSEAE